MIWNIVFVGIAQTLKRPFTKIYEHLVQCKEVQWVQFRERNILLECPHEHVPLFLDIIPRLRFLYEFLLDSCQEQIQINNQCF